jgi:hypothetical protein
MLEMRVTVCTTGQLRSKQADSWSDSFVCPHPLVPERPPKARHRWLVRHNRTSSASQVSALWCGRAPRSCSMDRAVRSSSALRADERELPGAANPGTLARAGAQVWRRGPARWWRRWSIPSASGGSLQAAQHEESVRQFFRVRSTGRRRLRATRAERRSSRASPSRRDASARHLRSTPPPGASDRHGRSPAPQITRVATRSAWTSREVIQMG